MSLLSKLLGDSKKELAPVLDALKEAAQKAGVDSLLSEAAAARPARDEAREEEKPWSQPARNGFSWGEDMPAEENQYSFKGDYLAYFDMVFSQEFPQFRITRETAAKGKTTVYSFWQGERQALVAEIMSERSEANKLRNTCRARGIPYVRFYHDHSGWWNTRSYVASRTRAALGL